MLTSRPEPRISGIEMLASASSPQEEVFSPESIPARSTAIALDSCVPSENVRDAPTLLASP